ncbi:PREDICTED: cyclin-D1-1 [Prunus dulcis]|uniref:B-like cyclin n=1 Tax=Prunus dulcis TaxID=3755 RepID=A0A5E4FDR3_PRUDU|nr:cyclin-D1-1 [Prunus dulcis]VVA26095.1 PREDICTED: cyclin-D1-1 [Prunus dulcis]
MSSVWSSDCFSDLLCCEDYSGILSGESPECSSDMESPACSEESIAGFIEDERNYVPGFDYLSRFNSDHSLDISARADSVAWILKVQSYYGFHPLTAYLSVNYLDRFLYSRRLPQANGWPMQLLSVACLSLAAKMEEPLVPSLLDLQVEGTQFIFEPRTIRRMELLVLGVLDWRLRSITPFSFVAFFACKLDPAATFIGFLVSRATEIILSNIKEASFLEYWPSCIAAAAILSAANEIPNLSLENPEHAESWCGGLSKEKIIGCYRLMQEVVVENSGIKKSSPDVLPQLRVTVRGRVRSSSESSSSSVSLSSSSPMSYKRRKLNNCLWVDDDKGNSE